jgi:hypothetical protein
MHASALTMKTISDIHLIHNSFHILIQYIILLITVYTASVNTLFITLKSYYIFSGEVNSGTG